MAVHPATELRRGRWIALSHSKSFVPLWLIAPEVFEVLKFSALLGPAAGHFEPSKNACGTGPFDVELHDRPRSGSDALLLPDWPTFYFFYLGSRIMKGPVLLWRKNNSFGTNTSYPNDAGKPTDRRRHTHHSPSLKIGSSAFLEIRATSPAPSDESDPSVLGR
jgi:hypothetical protein